MPEYLSPGVYVEEVPSANPPIAGVSTSTAAFVGIVPDTITMIERNPDFDPTKPKTAEDGPAPTNSRTVSWKFPLPQSDLDAAKKALDDLSEKTAAGGIVKPQRPTDQTGAGYKKFREAQANLAKVHRRFLVGDMKGAEVPTLCTTFTDFKKFFGGFSEDDSQNQLAHAVFGFFNNGGTRVYVMRFATLQDLQDPTALQPLESLDEISLVAAPGIVDEIVQGNLIDHCENMMDRFAILESPSRDADDLTLSQVKGSVRDSNYAALYFPRIEVFDSIKDLTDPDSEGKIMVGASGHIAGIYSRVDHNRGVHKAPANEVIRGTFGVEFQISRSQQDGLNPDGMCCIRMMNNAATVWGARTIGGDVQGDLKYVPVRRTLIFLEKSIDRGTQWVVFEPNDATLWGKITRSVSAFLTDVWRDGALFGTKPQDAFYVKCDGETNPIEERQNGRVLIEVGVAIVTPAEFVVFRISQWQNPAA